MDKGERELTLDSILLGIKPGETALVEYTSVSSPELLFYLMVNGCLKRDIPVIIDDIADTFSEYIKRLKITGLPTEDLLKVSVIKIGGNKDVGKVLGKVEIRRYSLDFSVYEEVYEKVVPKKPVCNPVLGIHKLFASLDFQDAMRLVRNIESFVGAETRFAVYFINRESLEERFPEILDLLEESVTSVFTWELHKEIYKFRIVKSPNLSIVGSEISLSGEDFFKLVKH
ncbi:DUF257 family protein [Thermococcus sp. 2319x1]|uniref:DUF257 family protein n=1 Tax=Thermococcus sp. 2319x1 TaxID=1674923 RepID=UPI001581B667|nr:DUF257 family protein [Thermococcus sp. 2319x1]